jgi:hypothetical protein
MTTELPKPEEVEAAIKANIAANGSLLLMTVGHLRPVACVRCRRPKGPNETVGAIHVNREMYFLCRECAE